MGKKLNLSKQKFGRLTAIKPNGNKNDNITWECGCECGSTVTVRTRDLRSGNTKSCGCLRKSLGKKSLTTHGMYGHPIYNTYRNMLKRCNNPKDTDYPHYGGRGIKICDRWNNFENFYKDMFPSWKESLTIDRKDNNGNYEPSNCSWENREIQAQNQRTTKLDKESVTEIRELHKKKPNLRCIDLAKQYTVSWGVIAGVLKFRTWKNIK